MDDGMRRCLACRAASQGDGDTIYGAQIVHSMWRALREHQRDHPRHEITADEDERMWLGYAALRPECVCGGSGYVPERPSWDEYFIDAARWASTRSTCLRAQVGAVIVDQYHRVLSTGYNGAPPGAADCLTVGCHMEDGHCQRALHAEVNAIAHAAAAGVAIRGARLYVWGYPTVCRECSKVVTAAGLTDVVCQRELRLTS